MSSNLDHSHRESKYKKCFWNIVGTETATQIICGIAVLASILSVVGFFVGGNGQFYDYWQVARAIVGACAYIFALVGIYRRKPKFILVCLIWIATRMFFYGSYAAGSLISLFPHSLLGYFYREVMDAFGKKTDVNKCDVDGHDKLLRYVAMLMLYIWIFDLIYKCYKYVSEKNDSDQAALPQSRISTISVHEGIKTPV